MHIFSNLAMRDRSRIQWYRYRQFVIYREEWQDSVYGDLYGYYGVLIDGDWCGDSEQAYIHRIIDYWYEDMEMNLRYPEWKY